MFSSSVARPTLKIVAKNSKKSILIQVVSCTYKAIGLIQRVRKSRKGKLSDTIGPEGNPRWFGHWRDL